MNDLKWKIITWKPWRFLFFRLSKIEHIDKMHTRYVYTPRNFKNIFSIKDEAKLYFILGQIQVVFGLILVYTKSIKIW